MIKESANLGIGVERGPSDIDECEVYTGKERRMGPLTSQRWYNKNKFHKKQESSNAPKLR